MYDRTLVIEYTQLQLVTSILCNCPSLTIGSKAMESLLDMEAVQKVIEKLFKTQEEFMKAEIEQSWTTKE